MFHGKWVSDVSLDALDGQLVGAPVLAMGHYGQEVAGVLYFHVDPDGPLLVPGCECAFIDHQSTDLDARKLVFSSVCAHGSGSPSHTLIWTLELFGDAEGFTTGDLSLEGEVRRADGSPGTATVSLEQAAEFVLDEDKECPRLVD